MRALVTGAGGFVGQWLCRALLRDGWEVDGISLEGEPAGGILRATERRAIHWHAADLAWETPTATRGASDGGRQRLHLEAPMRVADEHATDADGVLAHLLHRRPPDAIFHLAGIAFQANAAADAERAYAVNVGGMQRVLLSASLARQLGAADPLALVVGSAEQYGYHEPATSPLPETADCSPRTIYALTKLAQERLALALAGDGVLRVIATRSFNHSGPGQGGNFLIPSLVARAVAARASGGAVTIGNTDVIRDFLHVEDVVTAYISLVSRGHPGEVYNVCSGEGVRVGDLAQEVLAAAGVRAPLVVDPALQRAVDVPALVGSNAKLRAATGWTPVKSRSDIIQDLLDAAS